MTAHQPHDRKRTSNSPGPLPGGGAPTEWLPSEDPGATTPPLDSSDAYEPSLKCRFSKVRSHREGGLGAVFVAEDLEVPRQVALKEIRPAMADDMSARQQFLFEARVTGALEHPGIVPVYGCGIYQDGRPYYAMRFVEGDDLHEVAEAFHRRRKSHVSDAETNLELRQLLGRIIAVAQVLDFAHSRGVLHRDLKPRNIMIGAYGETLVVDWGLAKLTCDTSEANYHPSASAAPLPQSLSDSLEVSRMGTVKGTIAYMSPEQALGRIDLTGPAVDIYGLAATLYHLLAGAPPGASLDSREVLQYVQKGRLPALRQVAPWVPRPLEAICSKGMALAPADRYPSAGELARDLERWLADEPVSALAEPWGTRAARWLRRHRSWAIAAMASLLAITAVMGVSLLWVNRARRAERDARQEATHLLATARATADGLLDAASEQLKDIPEAEEVRSRLLAQAADSYREFLALRTTDPELREQAGWVQIRLAEVQRELGQSDEAAQTASSAVADFRSLVQEGYEPLTDSLGLAEALRHSSEIASDNEQLQRAATAIGQATAELTELIQSRPPRDIQVKALEARGKARIQQGIVATDREDLPEAVRAFEMALDDLQSATDLQPDEDSADPRRLERKYYAARAAVNLGHVLSRTEAPDEEVERAYRAGLRDATQIFDRESSDSRFADLLALAEGNLGDQLLYEEKSAEAAEVYQQGHDRYQELVERHPRIPRYRQGLILSLVGLARAARMAGDSAASEAHLRRAVAASDRLAEVARSLPIFHKAVVLPRWKLAEQLAKAERHEEAAEVALGIPDEMELSLAMLDDELVQPATLSRLHYNAACYLSKMAAAMVDPESKQRLFDRAAHELRTAATGLSDAERNGAAQDPDLKPLFEYHPNLSASVL